MDIKQLISGNNIQLELIKEEHRDNLKTAANYEQIWQFMPQKPVGDIFNTWFDNILDKLEKKSQITYVIQSKKDKVLIGSSSFFDLILEHKRLTLGYTWIMPTYWGSIIQLEARFLMLKEAFENWKFNRVEIGTDKRNKRSYYAIKKIGFIEEGILRQHMSNYNGELEDTIVFSMLASEWLEIKNNLEKIISDCK